jgi:imidazolonepropionase-like amidohydrolase
MRVRKIALVALAALVAALAGEPAARAEGKTLVVKGDLSLAILADRTASLDAVGLIIRDGRIAGYLAAEETVPEGAEVLDAGDAFILPGLIDAIALTPDARTDAPKPLTPDHRALDGFNPYADYAPLLATGVTTVWLSPTRNRLLSGVGAVVKVAGDDRVLSPRESLRLTLGGEGLNPPAVWEPPILLKPYEDPIVPAVPPPPASRAAAMAMLREVFHGATDGPLKDAHDRRLRVRIHVRSTDEIRLALRLADEIGIDAVLELADAAEAKKVLKEISASGLPFVLEEGGHDAATVLRETGRGVLAAVTGTRILAMAASVASGPRDRAALRTITIDAARILGVDARVGSLDIGKDADLVLMDGAPLSSDASIRTVLVNGEVVHERKTTPGLLAIRATRVLRGDGAVDEDVVIVVKDGCILEMGRNVRMPPDAERRVFCGTVVPGFVDAWSHAGVAPGDLSMPAVDAATPDEKTLERLRKRGVTSLVLLPSGTGSSAGLASVVKTTAPAGRHDIVSRSAGYLVNLTTGGDRAAHALYIRDLLDRVVGYVEAWNAYEIEKAAGKTKPKAPRRDSRMEPWRAIATGDLTLILRAERAEEIGDLLAIRSRFKDVRLALLGGTGALTRSGKLAGAGVPVVLGGLPFVDDPEGRPANLALTLVRNGVRVAMGSKGIPSGLEPLALLAEAVRSGVSPQAALAALTAVPADVFAVADRIGRIAPGLDADLVHLSADPGEPGCRVLHVVVGGRVVHESEDDR